MEWDTEKIARIFHALCERYELQPEPELFLNESRECITLYPGCKRDDNIIRIPTVILGKRRWNSQCNVSGLIHEFVHCLHWKHNQVRGIIPLGHTEYFYKLLIGVVNDTKDLIGEPYNWDMEYGHGREYLYRLGITINPPSLGTRIQSYKRFQKRW